MCIIYVGPCIHTCTLFSTNAYRNDSCNISNTTNGNVSFRSNSLRQHPILKWCVLLGMKALEPRDIRATSNWCNAAVFRCDLHRCVIIVYSQDGITPYNSWFSYQLNHSVNEYVLSVIDLVMLSWRKSVEEALPYIYFSRTYVRNIIHMTYTGLNLHQILNRYLRIFWHIWISATHWGSLHPIGVQAVLGNSVSGW